MTSDEQALALSAAWQRNAGESAGIAIISAPASAGERINLGSQADERGARQQSADSWRMKMWAGSTDLFSVTKISIAGTGHMANVAWTFGTRAASYQGDGGGAITTLLLRNSKHINAPYQPGDKKYGVIGVKMKVMAAAIMKAAA